MHRSPPLRVARLVSACSRCRSAKVRCDGKLPACTACEKVGKSAECSSSNERSYVAYLEAKIESLERRLHDQERAGVSINGYGSRGAAQIDTNGPAKKEETSAVDELVSDFGYLAVNATSNEYSGFDKDMSVARLVLSIAVKEPLPASNGISLPPRAEALGLLRTCVSTFFTLCPVMSFAAAAGTLERVLHPSHRLTSPLDMWNVRLMLGLGLCSQFNKPTDPQFQLGIRHVSVALETAGSSIIAPGSLERLQSFLLLVLFSTIAPSFLDSWYLIGMASRFMAEMGLHTTAGQKIDMKLSHIANRRHLFHLIYAMDRCISMSHLRPFGFSDDSVDLDLPKTFTPVDVLSGDVLSNHTSDDHAKAFLLLLQAQSKWYYDLYFSSRTSVYESWTTRLPDFHDNLSQLSHLNTFTNAFLSARFRAQVYFLAVLLVLPTPECVIATSSYGQAVGLECASSFVDALKGLLSSSGTLDCLKSDDYFRGILIGRRLLELFRNMPSEESAIPIASEEDLATSHTLPALGWSIQGRISRMLTEKLRSLDESLAILSTRFSQVTSYRAWKLELGVVVEPFRQDTTSF